MKGCSGAGGRAWLAFFSALAVALATAAVPASLTQGVTALNYQQIEPHQQHPRQQHALPGSLRILQLQRAAAQYFSHEERQAGQEVDMQATSPVEQITIDAAGAAAASSTTGAHKGNLMRPARDSHNTPTSISSNKSTEGGWQQWVYALAKRWPGRPANARLLQSVVSSGGGAPGGGDLDQASQITADSNSGTATVSADSASDAVQQPTADPDDPTASPELADASINTAGSLAAEAIDLASADSTALVQHTLQRVPEETPAAETAATNTNSGTTAGSSTSSGLAGGAVMRQLPQTAWEAQQPAEQQQQQQPEAATSSESHAFLGALSGGNNSVSDPGVGHSSNGSGNVPTVPLPALPVVQPSNSNSSSGNRPTPLKTLLQGISLSWQQHQQQGACPLLADNHDNSNKNEKCGDLLVAAWQDTLQQVVQQQPHLSGFAQLAGSHHLLLQMVASAGLPVIVFAPSNTALEAMLRQQQQGAATASSDKTGPPANSSWQQFVHSAQEAPAESILLLLRHIIPVRQPQLLDSLGDVSHQLLDKPTTTAGAGVYQQQQPQPSSQQQWAPGSNGSTRQTDLLVFNSLVLQTALGSYIQVSEMPDAPSAYRLELAAAAAAAAAANTSGVTDPKSRHETPPIIRDLAPDPLTQQQLLLANRNRSVNPNDTSAAATISHLHVGVHLRASTQPYQVNQTRVIVIGLNGILDESDEVVNGGTVARLRGAFGWSPDDEQALLSRVYLDPEATYWARTAQILDSLQGSKGHGSGAASEVESPAGTAPTQTAQPPPVTAANHEGLRDAGASRQSGGGRRKLSQNTTTSSSSSSSSSGGRNSSRESSTRHPIMGSNSASSLSAAAIAELIAWQQQRLTEFHMADALAANLMAIEALSAWTAAAVTHPAAVFAPLQPQASGITEVHGNNARDTTFNNDGSAGHQCLVDWGSPCGMPWGCIKTGSSSSSNCTTCCYLSPAAADDSDAAAPYYLNDSSSSSICPLNAAAAAGLGGLVSAGRCSAWDFHESSGSIDTTLLVGLSPYQMYPSLGQYDAAYDERNADAVAALEASAGVMLNTGSLPATTAATGTQPHTNGSNANNITESSSNNTSGSIHVLNTTTTRGLKQADVYRPTPGAGAGAPPPWQPLSSTLAARQLQPNSPAAPAAATFTGQVTGQGAETGSADPHVPTGSWEGVEQVLVPRQPAEVTAEAREASSPPPTEAAQTLATLAPPLEALPPPPSTAVNTTPTASNTTSPLPPAPAPSPVLRIPDSPSPSQSTAANSSSSANTTAIFSASYAVSSNSSSSGGNSNTIYRGDDSDTGTVSAVQYDPPRPPSPAAAPSTPPDNASCTTSSAAAQPLRVSTPVSAADGSAGAPALVTPSAAAAGDSNVNAQAGSASAGVWVRVPTDQLSYLSVLELAGLLSQGQVDPQQLVELYSSRLRRYDSLLHATVTFTDALAVQQAAAAVQTLQQHNVTFQQPPAPAADLSSVAISRGLRQFDTTTNINIQTTDGTAGPAQGAAGVLGGPDASQPGSQVPHAASKQSQVKGRLSLLTGIPYGLKDLFAVPGYPTSWGMSALRNRIINTPSWSFSALSGAAGGVLLAKTATGELAWGDVWFDDVTTRNPWNINTGSCGSSAGSAVAVAAGLLPYAVGSETWGSIVCPATTVGVTAFRPTGGSIPGHGMLQISASLDKSGVFCRQALDCAVVADALMDHGHIEESDGSQSPTAGNTTAHTTRLHQQNPQHASGFNYTAYQGLLQSRQQEQQTPWTGDGHSLLPPMFEQLPRLSLLCIGYLEGTSQNLIDALQALNPACVKGPLPLPGSSDMVRDVLSLILQVDVSVSLEGLWLEGYIDQDKHWYPLIQLGQVSPAAAYVKAQRLRALLLSQIKAYFKAHGIHVLLKASGPGGSDIGTDGLATLLDMPELLLPVGFTVAVQQGVSSTQEDDDLQQHQQQGSQQQQQQPESLSDPSAEQVWLQPDVNSVIAPPGHDAAVIAVGAAFQSVTAHHLVHPSLPAV